MLYPSELLKLRQERNDCFQSPCSSAVENFSRNVIPETLFYVMCFLILGPSSESGVKVSAAVRPILREDGTLVS